jgi:hypothetical protein
MSVWQPTQVSDASLCIKLTKIVTMAPMINAQCCNPSMIEEVPALSIPEQSRLERAGEKRAWAT